MIGGGRPDDGQLGSTLPVSGLRTAPRITTDRLVLRSFEGSDYEAYRAMMAEPSVFEHLGGTPLGEEEAMRRLSMYAGFWQIMGIGMWAVDDGATGMLIGQVGIFDLHRELEPPVTGTLEMGWIVTTECHGKGIAREACDAVLSWLEANTGGKNLFAVIGVRNEPSMKLAARLGFERRPDALYRDEPISVWDRVWPNA